MKLLGHEKDVLGRCIWEIGTCKGQEGLLYILYGPQYIQKREKETGVFSLKRTKFASKFKQVNQIAPVFNSFIFLHARVEL
jgi:hypothetical protein